VLGGRGNFYIKEKIGQKFTWRMAFVYFRGAFFKTKYPKAIYPSRNYIIYNSFCYKFV
jgi:hypothetical protein